MMPLAIGKHCPHHLKIITVRNILTGATRKSFSWAWRYICTGNKDNLVAARLPQPVKKKKKSCVCHQHYVNKQKV